MVVVPYKSPFLPCNGTLAATIPWLLQVKHRVIHLQQGSSSQLSRAMAVLSALLLLLLHAGAASSRSKLGRVKK